MRRQGQFRLIMRQGPAPGKVFEIVRDISTAGRDVRSDLVVNDAEVSRSHARLTRQPDGLLVEDLGSTNSTYINGQRLTGARLLRPGEKLGLGETVTLELEFLPDPQATVIAPQSYSPPAAHPGPPPAYAEPPPAAPAPAPRPAGNLRWLAFGCGCLSLAACLGAAAAVGLFLWNAPPEFWDTFSGVFGLR